MEEELFQSLNHCFQFFLITILYLTTGWAGQPLPGDRPAETCRFAALKCVSRKKPNINLIIREQIFPAAVFPRLWCAGRGRGCGRRAKEGGPELSLSPALCWTVVALGRKSGSKREEDLAHL